MNIPLSTLQCFDFRTNEEKKKRKEGCESKCQNQLYFYQNHLSQLKAKRDEATSVTQEVTGIDPNDNNGHTNALHKAIMKFAGGFGCLVGRSFKTDRDDEKAMATPEEINLVFRMFDMVVQMKDSLCQTFCKYNEA